MPTLISLLPRLGNLGNTIVRSDRHRNVLHWILRWTKCLLGNTNQRQWGELLGAVGMVMMQYGDQFGLKVMNMKEVEPLMVTGMALSVASYVFYEMAARNSSKYPGALFLGRACNCGVFTAMLTVSYKLQLFGMRA